MESRFDNEMRKQAESIPSLIRRIYHDLDPKTRELLSPGEINSIQKIILTGSGDSYCAGLATKSAFEQLTGLAVDVLTPIDIARHYPSHLLSSPTEKTMVIAVSNSGQASRTIEAAMRCKKYGALTVAVTADDQSPLSMHSDKTLQMVYEKMGASPGIRNYAAMLVTLYLFLIHLGDVRKCLLPQRSDAYRERLIKTCDEMEERFVDIDQICLSIAKNNSNCQFFEFMGSGADYASAWYGHEKIYEALGQASVHTDTENWFHVNFFHSDSLKTMRLLSVDTRNPGLSRAIELARTMEQMNRELVVVSNHPEDFPAKYRIRVADCGYDWLAPLSQFIPYAIISGYLAAINSISFPRKYQGSRSGFELSSTTDSEIVII